MSELTPLSQPAQAPDRSENPRPFLAWLARHRIAVAWSAILLFILLCGLATWWVLTLPERGGEQETFLLGSARLISGSPGGVRVLVRNVNTEKPVVGAQIEVGLQSRVSGSGRLLYAGRTDAYGTADVRFQVPEGISAESDLVVQTRSRLGRDWVSKPVQIVDSVKMLLTTDKPVYQPGQTMHIRLLLLNALDYKPVAEQVVSLLIEDARSNKVLRKSLKTSAYGIASAEFQLAQEVNQGSYKIVAEHEKAKADKLVTVQWYVLPKFKVAVTTEKPFYLLGDTVRGRVQVDYFFGKPVAGGKVTLLGTIQDRGRKEVADVRGQTDDKGSFAFTIRSPRELPAGTQDVVSYNLEVTVIDTAGHAEDATHAVPIASGAMLIDAVPESGQLRAGVENIIYLVTSYPNGAPAPAMLEIEYGDDLLAFEANAHGVAEWRVKPKGRELVFLVYARDKTGWMARKPIKLQADVARQQLLLRPERPVYRVGEKMRLEAFVVGGTRICYLDLVKEGQTVAMYAADVRDGRATFDVTLGPESVGTLELRAYQVQRDGTPLVDMRLVVVNTAADDLQVGLKVDRDVYRPGDNAKLAFQLTRQNKPVQGALGLSIVDESVFSVAEQDPGQTRLYFLLEAELLQSRYHIKETLEPELLPAEPPAPDPQRLALSQAALARVPSKSVAVLVNSRAEKLEKLRQRQDRALGRFGEVLAYVVGIPPLMAAGLVVSRFVRRAQPRIRPSRFLENLIAGLFLLFALVATVAAGFWAISEGSAIGAILLLGVVFGALVGGLINLARRAARYADESLQIILLLVVAQTLLLGLMVYTAMRGGGVSRLALVFVSAAYLLGAAGICLLGLERHPSEEEGGRGRLAPIFLAMTQAAFIVGILLMGAIALTGCSPKVVEITRIVEKAVEKVVKETVIVERPLVVEKVVEKPVEVQKEVTRVVEKGVQPTPAPGKAQPTAAPKAAEVPTAEPPRLRQYFPETLYWSPEAITDEAGRLDLEVPLADSITTWRLSAQASTAQGALGGLTAGLRVFQDFFIDLDLPVALTQNDEIAMPVSVYNYLGQAQRVRLELTQAPWFELLDQPSKELTIGSGEVKGVYFRIKAREFGQQRLTVTAWGERMSDAMSKEVRVLPDGKEMQFAYSDWLKERAQSVVRISNDAIPGTAKLLVKVYPGPLSHLVEGLDAILRMPSGCFEQTTSSTYPNVLVLEYLNRTQRATPQIRAKAERYIGLGYQRLLTFEVPGGGFSLYGRAPASVALTAYGLLEFRDMAQVYPVDPGLIERTAYWLRRQQSVGGGWGDLTTTAFVTWALAEAGYANTREVQLGLSALRQNWAKEGDPYRLALIANAMAAAQDPATGQVLDALERYKVPRGDAMRWAAVSPSIMGSYGRTGDVEATALAAYAMLRGGMYPDSVRGGLTHLIQAKDPRGTWYSTQATILALKALAMAASKEGSAEGQGEVLVALNGVRAEPIRITEATADVVHMLAFDNVQGGDNVIEFQSKGARNLMAQVTAEYYLPWDKVPAEELENKQMALDVVYDRTTLAVNEVIKATATMRLERDLSAVTTVASLGVPPGFAVESADLEALVKQGTIRRYEMTGREVLLYIENMQAHSQVEVNYRLKAKYALKVKSLASVAYDYYNPATQGSVMPRLFVVQ